jgi:ribosomal protein S18 acetylase RimI-like enzyme
MSEDGETALREATPADVPFLWRMLAQTADLVSVPPVAQVQQDPGLSPYLAGWGRDGDAGIVANVRGELIGAAWHRLFPADRPGYGFVAEDIPEISIAVDENWRGRGVGRSLLAALVDRARRDRRQALSLSVDARNESAVRLYRSMGFETVGGQPGNPTMLLRLVG